LKPKSLKLIAGSLLQVADSVDPQRDPVAGGQDCAGGVGVGSVGVVENGGRKERTDEENQPQAKK